MSGDKAFYILSLDGGGARGIYSAQVLAKLEERFSAPVREHFDLIAGTSAGAIIAGAAAEIPLEKMVELFERQATRIFSRRPLHWGIFRSKYSQNLLQDVLQKILPSITLGDIATPLIITASNISTGEVQVFKSRYLADLNLCHTTATATFPW